MILSYILLLLLSTLQLSLTSYAPDKKFVDSSVGDFRELLVDPRSGALFVGSEGAVFRLWAYNINDTSDNVFAKKVLSINEEDEAECKSMASDVSLCRPATRFISFINNMESIYVCSSVGQKPEIRVLDALSLKDMQDPRTEIGICAPDATVNATAVVVEKGNPDDSVSVYSGIRTGMGGENHLIYRPPLVRNGKQLHPSIRTIYTDNKWLNEPQFVGAFEAGEHVFFFFREIAHESAFGERVIHSRVARVCKKDVGGRNVLRQVWTSFVKARLNCSISANQPYYFDHIQSVTKVDVEGDSLFFAALSTSDTAFVSSAVCVFALSSINHAFDNSLLLEESPRGGWQAVSPDAMPQHRPGSCSSSSQSISDSDLHFAKTHLLLAEAISGGIPIEPTRDHVFTHVLVDTLPQQNVVFAIDSSAKVMWKVVHWKEGNEWKSKLLETRSLQLQNRIHNAAILPSEYVFFSTRDQVAQFSVAACSFFASCASCSLDPYCSWNAANSSCHQRQKSHEKSIGWISSSRPGHVANECKAVDQSKSREVYLGDAVRLVTPQKGQWIKDGNKIDESVSKVLTSGGDLILLNVQSEDNGVYECVRGETLLVRVKIIVQEDCVKPKTVESYKSCQREWCKKADAYKTALNLWSETNRKSVECISNDSARHIS